MYRTRTTSRVGRNGVLNLRLTTPLPEGNVDVVVDVSPAKDERPAEDWHAFVHRLAGSIADPTFLRHPQPPIEVRGPLD